MPRLCILLGEWRDWLGIAAACLLLATAISLRRVYAAEPSLFLKEGFETLERWKPLKFAKIERLTHYSITQENGNSILKTESQASASGLVFQQRFNVYRFPLLQWRWKVENLYQKADPTRKEGDDYPIRIYVLFAYDPQKANLLESLWYEVLRLIYGEYPPHSSLNYAWASRAHPALIVPNPYSDRVQMILLQQGSAQRGEWLEYQRNLLADYRQAFQNEPPEMATLAIMNDSDNTGEQAVSYVDDLRIEQGSEGH